MTEHNHVEQFRCMRLFISTLVAISLVSSCTSEHKSDATAPATKPPSTTAPVSTSPDTKVQGNAPKTTVLKEFTEFKLPDEFSSFDTEPGPAPSKQLTTSQSQRKVKSEQGPEPKRTTQSAAEYTWYDTPNDACAQLDKSTAFDISKDRTYEIIGHSTKGTPLVVEHFGSRSGPQILVVGQVHGNECSPALFVKAMRDLVSSSWGVYLLPTLNPDGLKELDRRSSGIDLNRDGFNLVSPETRALMDFTASRDLFLTIHVHSPNGWVGYHGTNRASDLARVLSDSMGQSFLRSAGSGRGFLWEGQAKRVEGHESVLVELPAVFAQEASSALERVQYSLEEVGSMVERMTKALFEYMNQEASGWLGAIASK